MIVAVFEEREVIFDKYGVTISGIEFLLNERAIGKLNQQAHENAGQYAAPARCAACYGLVQLGISAGTPREAIDSAILQLSQPDKACP